MMDGMVTIYNKTDKPQHCLVHGEMIAIPPTGGGIIGQALVSQKRHKTVLKSLEGLVTLDRNEIEGVLDNRISDLKSEIAALKEKNEALQSEIASLKDSLAGDAKGKKTKK
jgi:hypothetical protein